MRKSKKFNPSTDSKWFWVGDNLEIMDGLESNIVDLIYLDPPFNAKKNFVNIFKVKNKKIRLEFRDIWNPSPDDNIIMEIINEKNQYLHDYINTIGDVAGLKFKSYLTYMGIRLLEMHRILKRNGTIYLHCDKTVGHYLKGVMDCIFGINNFRNEIIWYYGKMAKVGKNFSSNHDTILRYSKSGNYKFQPIKATESEYKKRFARYLKGNRVHYGSVKNSKDKLVLSRIEKIKEKLGRKLKDKDVLFNFDKEFKIQSDVIYVPKIKGNAAEWLGYPTQKPLDLLKKIIQSSSKKNDLVFDPFAGGGTTLVAANELDRRWIGCDIAGASVPILNGRIKQGVRSAQSITIGKGTKKKVSTSVHYPSNLPDRKRKSETVASRKLRNILAYEQIDKAKFECPGCGESLTLKHFHVDHRIPKSRKGSNSKENRMLLCGPCNLSKGKKTWEEWKKQQRSK